MFSLSTFEGVLIGVLILYLSLAIRWVPKPYNWIIEMNFPGRPTGSYTWGPGLRILWLPIKPIMFVREKIDMAQKPITLHIGMPTGVGRPDPVDFKDIKAGALVQVIYQVIDPLLATYAVQEHDLNITSIDEVGQETSITLKGYERASLNKIEADLRSFFGRYKFDDANQDLAKTEIETGVLAIGREALKNWGIMVHLIDIIDFILGPEAAALREQRLAADIQAEIYIKEAEGQKTATITLAEGNKQAAQMAGEGEGNRLRAVMGIGLLPHEAAAYVLAQESTKALAQAKTTVIATSEGGNMSQLASLGGMMKGIFGGGQQPPSPSAPTEPRDSEVIPPKASPAVDPNQTALDNPPHAGERKRGAGNRNRNP